MAPAVRRAHLGEERHQRADDQDRLEPLAQHDHEGLDEEVERREPLAQHRAGAVESGGEPRSRAASSSGPAPCGRRGAQGGELGLQLGGQAGVLAAELALDLLEGHVGVERAWCRRRDRPVRARA